VDDTLTIAAKSIAEIITLPGYINLDFADVNTTLENGGVALMSNGYGQGERRLEQAIEDAFHSPLLNNNDVFTAKKILFNISFSTEFEIKIEELDFIHDFMACFTSQKINVIWGAAFDETLGDKIKFTVLASGFRMDHIPEIKEKRAEEIKRKSEEELMIEAEITRKQQEEEDLIAKFYGEEEQGKIRIRPVSRSSIVVLSLDEMINDDIIAIMEDYPTYCRDPKLIAKARIKAIPENNMKNVEEITPVHKSPPANHDNSTPRIRFT
jgi:cell division protein FtsZ